MIELALDTEEQMKRMATGPMGNPAQQLKAAPIQKSVAEEMGNMAKQRAMSGALDMGTEALMSGSTAPVVGSAIEGGAMLGPMAGSGAMASIGTAMPYVGAGLLAGKAFGLFSDGGFVGPLSTAYASEGYQVPGSTEYNKRMDRNRAKIAQERPVEGLKNADQETKNFNEGLRQLRKQQDFVYPMIVSDYGATMSPTTNMQRGVARMAFTDDPIAQKMYSVGNAPLDTSSSGMYANYIGLPIDSQGYTARGYSSGGNVEIPKPKPEASELFKEIQKKYIENDPYGSDTTSSPFDMLRSDNASST